MIGTPLSQEAQAVRVRLIGAAESEVVEVEKLLSASRSRRFEVVRTTSVAVGGDADVLILCHQDSGDDHERGRLRVEELDRGLPWVALAERGDEHLAAHAIELGARAFLSLETLDTVQLVTALMAAVRGERQLADLREQCDRDRQLATHDQLTGLAGRQLFNDRLDRAMASARRSGKKLGVLFIDIDHFKIVNDTLGHAAGDELLVRMAETLSGLVRESDTAARLGGDEFALLLEHMRDELDASIVARKILDILGDRVIVKGRPIDCSVSIGIATVPSNGQTVPDLLKRADVAMYHAKKSGRNRFEFYTRGMNARVLRRAAIETGLRSAIREDALVMHYQPFFDLRRERVVGAEALLRWQHPQLGPVEPAEFIPIAEALGQIGEIGEWVLRTACRQAVSWQALGHSGFRMAVNVSPRQLRQSDFSRTVEGVLRETGLSPKTLELEITEGGLVREADHMIETLRELKRLGLHLSVDDFGTGYSSLAYLKDLPVDVLKIDRSFVTSLLTDPLGATIVEAIVHLAQGLNLATVAEGVETRDQLLLLGSYGCNRMQGYLFGRPEIPARFERWITSPSFRWAEIEDSGGF